MAAERGNIWAQALVSYLLYSFGQADWADPIEAHFWHNVAAAQLPPGEARDGLIRNRDIIARELNPWRLAEAERRAREWSVENAKGWYAEP